MHVEIKLLLYFCLVRCAHFSPHFFFFLSRSAHGRAKFCFVFVVFRLKTCSMCTPVCEIFDSIYLGDDCQKSEQTICFPCFCRIVFPNSQFMHVHIARDCNPPDTTPYVCVIMPCSRIPNEPQNERITKAKWATQTKRVRESNGWVQQSVANDVAHIVVEHRTRFGRSSARQRAHKCSQIRQLDTQLCVSAHVSDVRKCIRNVPFFVCDTDSTPRSRHERRLPLM